MKNVLLFGATGYVGKKFVELYGDRYHIIQAPGSQELDFRSPDIDRVLRLAESPLDGVLFLQGCNPSVSAYEVDDAHFRGMMDINIMTPLKIVRALHCNDLLSRSASVIFVSSIARLKGSYDPAYASAKAGLQGLQATLSNYFPHVRFNSISLGLVGGSPVHRGMTPDFVQKHLDAMGGALVDVKDACKTIELLLECSSISRAMIDIDRGHKV